MKKITTLADKMAEKANKGILHSILLEINSMAKAGYKSLSLYQGRCTSGFWPDFVYERTFKYNYSHLEALKKLGFTIVSLEVDRSTGFLWWKKTETEVYHTVTWE